jgi:hypothetical protein
VPSNEPEDADRLEFEILRDIFEENKNPAIPQKPERPPLGTESKRQRVAFNLHVGGFVGVDENGKLALTEDGLELLKSKVRLLLKARESGHRGERQNPPDPSP